MKIQLLMEYQNNRLNFFSYRSLPFLLLIVMFSIGLVGTVGASKGTGQNFYLPTTLLNNPEISVPEMQNVQAQEYLSVLPLSFIPNAGQIDPLVKYIATGHQSTLYFTPDEIVIAARENSISQPVTHVIRQTFPGANANPVVEAEDQPLWFSELLFRKRAFTMADQCIYLWVCDIPRPVFRH